MSIDDHFFPLSELGAGEEALVYEILPGKGEGKGRGRGRGRGPRRADRNRLRDLGLLRGVKVRMVVNNDPTYLIEFKGCRYGVGRGLVDKVLVYKP